MNTDLQLVPAHFDRFVQSTEAHQVQTRVGRNVRRWAVSIGAPRAVTLALPDSSIDRIELRQLCRDCRVSDLACFCAVMAWGGMRADHARLVQKHQETWIPTLSRIRTEVTIPRSEAFTLLEGHRRNGELPGIRAAFFTKLIFFLRSVPDGYIMDQWTAKSVNLLHGQSIVDLTPQGFVSDENTAENYEQFCRGIELVAEVWPASPKPSGGQVEEWMMSVGGQKPGAWRQYLRAARAS